MFTLDHSVSSRVAKYTYGIESCTPYEPQRADHRAREHASFRARSGELMMPNSFMAILEKVHFYTLVKYFFANIQVNRIPKCQKKKSSECLTIMNILLPSFRR